MIRRFPLLAAHLASLALLPVTMFAAEPEAAIQTRVVQIHTTHRFPDVGKPWTQSEARKSSGTGVIIAGNRILTNAHVVNNGTEIYVQPYQSSDMHEAKVVAIARGIDLALVELVDPAFFEGRGHIELSDTLPNPRDKISAYGYPVGGSEQSVTEGIVSRIEFASYYDETAGLRLQVDAALNPGNSGGPAIANDKIVGLVFSGIPDSQSIGYLIPAEEIRLFLEDVADGSYQGKPLMMDSLQTMENPAIREKLALPRDKGGFMIADVYDADDGKYPLKRWDVLLQIGDYPLDSQGSVIIGNNLRVEAKYLLQRLVRDGHVPCKIWRDGAEIDVSVPIRYSLDRVVPRLGDARPSYFFYGPMVFSAATQELAGAAAGMRGGPPRAANPIFQRIADRPEFPDEQLVVVCSRVFPHPVMKGYDMPFLFVVESVNDIKVRNLRHLVEILRDMKDRFVAFKFAGDGMFTPEIPVFEHAKMLAATERVIDDNGVRSPYSEDLAAVWKAKP